jgi:hypothetical protein
MLNLPARMTPTRRRALGLLASLAVAVASLVASYSAGAPKTYPGIALGWGLIFHVERAGLLLGFVALFVLVVWRALNLEFPIKFGQILEYAPREVLPFFERMHVNLEERVATLEQEIRINSKSGDRDD